MQHKMLVTVVLLAGLSLAFAVESAECPPAGQQNPWHSQPALAPVDDNSSQGSCRELQTGQTDFLKVSGRPAGPVEADDVTRYLRPFMDWGDDVRVGASGMTPTFGKVSADAAANGDMYVGLLAPVSGVEDTVTIWRSTNGGTSWAYWSRLVGLASTGGIRDFVMRVGSDANGDWVYTFALYDGATTDGGLWVRRSRPDLSGSSWRQIVVRGDTLLNVVADRNIETPQHLFVAFQSTGTRVSFASSADSGQTWGNFGYLSTDRRQPTICAGGDKYVYIGSLLNSDSCRIRMGRHNNNLISGGTWSFVNVDSGADNRFYDISVAADRTAPGASQSAMVLSTYRYNPNGNVGPRYGWTLNGGTSWDASFWPPTNQGRTTWDFRYPYLRWAYNTNAFRAVVTGMEPSTNFDTLFYAWSLGTSPTTWEGRATPNDYSITGEYGANIDYSSDASGGFIAYREYGAKDVWVDVWDWVSGVEEGKTPVNPAAAGLPTLLGRDGALNLSLPASARVRAQLVDGTGRVAETVYDGRLDAGAHRLPIPTSGIGEGVYFLNLDVNGRHQSTKLVHVR